MLPIRDREQPNIFPIITVLIIFINVIVLVAEYLTPELDSFVEQWALIPSSINFQQIRTFYPFVTSMFLHAGLFHLLSNMWFLQIFGDNVEAELGHFRYLIFYLLGGIIATLAQYYIDPTSDVVILGASGAIAAVMGFYIIRFPRHMIQTWIISLSFFTIYLPAQVILGFWFLTQLFNGTSAIISSTINSGVAWWAHVGGFIFGVVIALLLSKKKNPSLHLQQKQSYEQI